MAKTQSLVAKAESALPAPGGETQITDQRPAFSMTPYVSFVSLKSTAFAKVAPYFPDLQEGEPVLYQADPIRPMRLDPFRFVLVHAMAHWSEVENNTGEILRSVLDAETAKGDKTLREHVECVAIALLPEGKVLPVRVTFKTTKTKAVWSAIRAIEMSTKEPEVWAALSPEHKMTLGIADPRFRLVTTVKLSFGQTSRSSGFKFTVAAGVVRPTGVPEWKAITDAIADKDFCALTEECARQWRERVEMIRSKSTE